MLKSKDKAKQNTIILYYLLSFFSIFVSTYVDIFIVGNADALYQLCRRGILFQRECCLYYLYIIFIATFISEQRQQQPVCWPG